MDEVGIRALKQNASAVVARAAAGEIITITDHGTPVARMTPTAQPCTWKASSPRIGGCSTGRWSSDSPR